MANRFLGFRPRKSDGTRVITEAPQEDQTLPITCSFVRQINFSIQYKHRTGYLLSIEGSGY